MLDINIDFEMFAHTIASEMGFSQGEVDSLVDETLDEVSFRFMEEVKFEAGHELRGTRDDYINGLYHVKLAKGVYEVGLKGFLPNALESGLSAYDMKEGFAKSAKVKYTADGSWYLTVPFRHAVSTSVATSSTFSGIMPQPVSKAVKQAFDSGRKSIKDADIPKAFREAKRNASSNYKHKANIYQGMIHSKKANHSHYTTFRRVSENSDDSSWQHPGLKAHKLFESSIEALPIDRIVESKVRKFL